MSKNDVTDWQVPTVTAKDDDGWGMGKSLDMAPLLGEAKTLLHSGEAIPSDIEFPVLYIHDDGSESLCFDWSHLRRAVAYDSRLVAIPASIFTLGTLATLFVGWLLGWF